MTRPNIFHCEKITRTRIHQHAPLPSGVIHIMSLRIVEAHDDEVWFLQFSHNEKYQVSSYIDLSVVTWEIMVLFFCFFLNIVQIDYNILCYVLVELVFLSIWLYTFLIDTCIFLGIGALCNVANLQQIWDTTVANF